MNIIFKRFILFPAILFAISCNSPAGNENTYISIKTTLGDIKIKLYDDTPIHRDNFIKLVHTGFYEGISFHRIIKNFMIQAGDPDSKTGNTKELADSMKTYTLSAEFNKKYFHKKGALAAAREGNEVNPEMRSSGTQFYIVQGVKYTDEELDQAEQKINNNIRQSLFNKIIKETADSCRASGNTISDAVIQEIASLKIFQYLTDNKVYKIPEDQRNVYKTTGGVPRLDGTYTVFGEVVEGLDVVDKIGSVSTDSNDRPLNDVKILKLKIIRN